MKTIFRLTTNEMKKILGGANDGRCSATVTCSDDKSLECKCSSGTCESGTDYVKCACDGVSLVEHRCSGNQIL